MRTSRSILTFLALLAAMLWTHPAMAQQPSAAPAEAPAGPLTAELLARLQDGGFLIYFRHSTTPNYIDPDTSSLHDCATQRNLSRDGREQAKAIGKAFRDLELPVGLVRASTYCRSSDTARLAFGRVERADELILSGDDKADLESGRVKHLRNLAKILPWPGTNTVFVGHGSGLTILGGKFAAEGEAVIVRPTGKGHEFITQIKAEEWVAPR